MDLFQGGKWKKYNILKEEAQLIPFLPETALFSEENLWHFLNKYTDVILKPKSGCGGRGILKISMLGESQYEVHFKKTKHLFSEQADLYSFVKDHKKPRKYIIQFCIPLARFQDRPFDVRAIVQRKKGTEEWTVSGKYAKVASEGYIVTNLARNGHALPLETAIRKSNTGDVSEEKILMDLDQTARLTAKQLSSVYTNHHMWGLDMGIDSHGRIWIIEANPTPRVAGFKKLEDKSMYDTIKSYLEYNLQENEETI